MPTAVASIAQIEIDPETRRPAHPKRLSGPRGFRIAEAGERYRTEASAVVEDADEIIHLIYDPALSPGNGRASRLVTTAGGSPALAEAVTSVTGRRVEKHHAMVAFGPGFVDWPGESHRVREVVASDITAAIQELRPIDCDGLISVMMPWLAQIAGIVIASGFRGQDAIAVKDRAIGRAYNGLAQDMYGNWNSKGVLATEYPIWGFMAECVALEAIDIAANLPQCIPVPVISHGIRTAVFRTMGHARIPVEEQRPTPAAR